MLPSFNYQKMAFVFSGSRWEQFQESKTPGPASYFSPSPDQPSPKAKSLKIKKGFTCVRKQQIPALDDVGSFIQSIPRNNSKVIRRLSTPSKVAQSNVPKQNVAPKNFIKVSSLTPKFIQSNAFGNSKQNQMTLESSACYDYLSRKTPPSIKRPTVDHFYIGSKYRKDIDESHRLVSPNKKKLMRGSAKCRVKEEKSFDSAEEAQTEKQFSQALFKNKKQKPLSAKNPFRKRDDLCANQSSIKDEGPTGIEDSNANESQFIENAYPGPGEYNPIYKSKSTKKGLMFTHSKERFEAPSKTDCGRDFYVTSQPSFKKTSKASQNKVGFGTSLAQGSQPEQKPNQFFDDLQSIENKATKNYLSSKIKPGFFYSRQPRFEQKKACSAQNILAYKEQLQRQDQLEAKIKSHVISNAQRHRTKKPHKTASEAGAQAHLTSGVDFSGQEFKTLKTQLDKVQERVQITQDFNIAFMTTKDRFACEKQKQQRRCYRSDVQIKHQLIDGFYGLRERPVQKTEGPTYSFPKSPKQVLPAEERMTPSPCEYEKPSNWIRPTFNKKFICEGGNETGGK